MNRKKLAALILTAAMILPITACSGSNTPSDTVSTQPENTVQTTISENETTSPEGIPELGARDLGGFEFHLGKPVQGNVAWATVTFAADEENGEVLNDAIVRRNQLITEKYNFSMKETELTSATDEMTKQILAGDDQYDLFMDRLDKVRAVLTSEYLINWYDIPHIELESSWWDQDAQRDLDLGDGMYFMNGDIVFTVYDCLRAIMYNKGLVSDFKLEDTYGSFYDLVKDGKWTVDTMYEMMNTVAADLNGDGFMGEDDRFGVLYNHQSAGSLVTSQGHQLVSKDSDGYPIFTAEGEKFTKIYENILKLISGNISFNYNADKYKGLTARQAIVALFDNKQALFFDNGISAAAQYMRDVQNVDFGFLPMPKFDETQDKYYSFVSVSAPVMTVPKTIDSDRLEKMGFALEALCRESSESVVPEYFETCFSAKYTRDEQSYEMIILATESRRYDLGIIYDYGGVYTTLRDSSEANNESVTSVFESIKSAVEKSITEYHGERK